MRTRPLLFCWLLAAAVGAVSCASLDRRLSRRFLEPRRDLAATPDELGLEWEESWLAAADGTRLHLAFVRGGAGPRPTVLLLHGSRANSSYYFPYYEFLARAGFHVALLDYRGYGQSSGVPSFAETGDDVERAVDVIAAREDVASLALYGVSLGTIFALRAAAGRSDVAAVVVEDCVSPRRELDAELHRARLWHPVRPLVRGVLELLGVPARVEPAANAARIEAPILVIQGLEDRATMVAASRSVVERAGGPRIAWWVEGAGHAPDPLQRRDGVYQEIVTRFLAGEGIDLEGLRERPPTARAASTARVAELRERSARGAGALELAPALDEIPPDWPRAADAELADLLVESGALDLSVDDAGQRARGVRLLERAVAAAPERPRLHWWGGDARYRVGFAHADAVRRAAALLRKAHARGEGTLDRIDVEAALFRLDQAGL